MKKTKTPRAKTPRAKTLSDRLTEIYHFDPVGQLAVSLVQEGETVRTVLDALEDIHHLPTSLTVELVNKVSDVVRGSYHTYNRYGCACACREATPHQ